MRVMFKSVLGVVFIIIGLAALVTPLTPGSWLIIVGLELLGLGFLVPNRVRVYWEELKKKLSGKK